MSTSTEPRRIKILMLHGYTQSGPLFHAKTRALEKSLQKHFPAPAYALSLHYPTGPHKIEPSSIPGMDPASVDDVEAYGWWRRKDAGDGTGRFWYEGIEAGLARAAEALQEEGPFDGALGFSQGGALAGMVAALLEDGRKEGFERAERNGGIAFPEAFSQLRHPRLGFAVSYSGFAADNPLYAGFYNPPIETPMLHFLGSVDTVVSEERSLRLVRACREGRGVGDRRVVYHPGSHFLPSQKQYVNVLAGFISEVMGWDEGRGTDSKSDENVEDMDVPF